MLGVASGAPQVTNLCATFDQVLAAVVLRVASRAPQIFVQLLTRSWPELCQGWLVGHYKSLCDYCIY